MSPRGNEHGKYTVTGPVKSCDTCFWYLRHEGRSTGTCTIPISEAFIETISEPWSPNPWTHANAGRNCEGWLPYDLPQGIWEALQQLDIKGAVLREAIRIARRDRASNDPW